MKSFNSLSATLVLLIAFATQATCEPPTIIGWDNQLFPSYLLATSTMDQRGMKVDPSNLGDPFGQLGVALKASKRNQQVTVRIECPEFFEASEYAGVLPSKGDTYSILPRMKYRYDRLSNNRQSTPVTVVFHVDIEDQPTMQYSKTMVVRSINDCPLMVVSEEETINTKFTMATFVNEQHPLIDSMLQEATERGTIDQFSGYQENDPQAVVRQIYALWDLLVARGASYSHDLTTSPISRNVSGRHVSLIEETINNSHASSVDGAVLMVSMLRRIGIEAHLVLDSGHFFLCFAVDETGSQVLGLDMGMINQNHDSLLSANELLTNSVVDSERNPNSWPSFVASIQHATARLSMLEARSSELPARYETTSSIINISEARRAGIFPIPFQEKEALVSFETSAAGLDSITESSPSDRILNSDPSSAAEDETNQTY